MLTNLFSSKRPGTESRNNAPAKCPVNGHKTMHSTGCGYATMQGRQDWLACHGIKGDAAESISSSLVADPNPSKPLYYWQLHSLLGSERIVAIVDRFYKRVYADNDAPWFRDAFTRLGSLQHHVHTQAAFWVDAFGGGKAYHGGDFRLNFHHTHNAAHVMNAEGAKRWMHHMGKVLVETDFRDVDPRIKPCIVDFLRTKMMKYAKQHSWDFTEEDFDFVKDDPELQ